MVLKVCGMRDVDNMKALEALRPDFMGLIFHKPSPRNIVDTSFAQTISSINITKVGVFVNANREIIMRKSVQFGFEMVQLHGEESATECADLQRLGLKVIKAFGIGVAMDIEKLKQYEEYCDYFLFDTKTAQRGGSGQKFEWGLLANYTLSRKFLLSGGIKPEDAEHILTINHPAFAGIDINSGFEISPGIKNIQLIGEFKKRINHGNNYQLPSK